MAGLAALWALGATEASASGFGYQGAGSTGELYVLLALVFGIPLLIVLMLLGALIARLTVGKGKGLTGAAYGVGVTVILPFCLTDDWMHQSKKLIGMLMASAVVGLAGLMFLAFARQFKRASQARQMRREAVTAASGPRMPAAAASGTGTPVAVWSPVPETKAVVHPRPQSETGPGVPG